METPNVDSQKDNTVIKTKNMEGGHNAVHNKVDKESAEVKYKKYAKGDSIKTMEPAEVEYMK